MNAQALLDGACGWLDRPERWVREDYADDGDGVSVPPVHAARTDLLGALAKVLRINPVVFSTSREDWTDSLAVAVDRLAHTIDRGNRFDDPVGIIAKFNDLPTTTFDDVRLVLTNATYPEGTK